MDQLFGDENEMTDQWLDRNNQNRKRLDQLADSCTNTPKKTKIEKVLTISPIQKTNNSDISYGSVYDLESDLSFDKSKSNRKYTSMRMSQQFSPIMGSTPKPVKTLKTRCRGRTQRIRKKCHNRDISCIGLWDKAIVKSPELEQWIHSFNEDMKIIESSELSVTQSSGSFTDLAES